MFHTIDVSSPGSDPMVMHLTHQIPALVRPRFAEKTWQELQRLFSLGSVLLWLTELRKDTEGVEVGVDSLSWFVSYHLYGVSL